MTYHGTYKSWHYSPLAQIDAGNVKKLTEVWSHVASRVNRGLQGFPLVVDGVLYNEHTEHETALAHEKTASDVITRMLAAHAVAGRQQMKQEMQRDFKKLMGLDEDLKRLQDEINTLHPL